MKQKNSDNNTESNWTNKYIPHKKFFKNEYKNVFQLNTFEKFHEKCLRKALISILYSFIHIFIQLQSMRYYK